MKYKLDGIILVVFGLYLFAVRICCVTQIDPVQPITRKLNLSLIKVGNNCSIRGSSCLDHVLMVILGVTLCCESTVWRWRGLMKDCWIKITEGFESMTKKELDRAYHFIE